MLHLFQYVTSCRTRQGLSMQFQYLDRKLVWVAFGQSLVTGISGYHSTCLMHSAMYMAQMRPIKSTWYPPMCRQWWIQPRGFSGPRFIIFMIQRKVGHKDKDILHLQVISRIYVSHSLYELCDPRYHCVVYTVLKYMSFYDKRQRQCSNTFLDNCAKSILANTTLPALTSEKKTKGTTITTF